MPRFIVTTKQMKNANGISIELGQFVELISQSMSNPVLSNGCQSIVDAFMRIYGIDIHRADILSMIYQTAEQINFFTYLNFKYNERQRI